MIDTLLRSQAFLDLCDHIALDRLKYWRELLVEEREKLDIIERKPHEEEGWVELVQDIRAIDRVIAFFEGSSNYFF
jgi:hypothetical protein